MEIAICVKTHCNFQSVFVVIFFLIFISYIVRTFLCAGGNTCTIIYMYLSVYVNIISLMCFLSQWKIKLGIYANDIRQAFIAAVMPRLLSYVQIPICTNKRQSFSSGTINPKQTNKQSPVLLYICIYHRMWGRLLRVLYTMKVTRVVTIWRRDL